MWILDPTLLHDQCPGFLGIVEDEGDELHFGFFRRIVHRPRLRGGRAAAGPGIEQCEEIAFEDEAEHQQYQEAPDSDAVPEAKTGAASAAIIFKVFTTATGRPSHGNLDADA